MPAKVLILILATILGGCNNLENKTPAQIVDKSNNLEQLPSVVVEAQPLQFNTSYSTTQIDSKPKVEKAPVKTDKPVAPTRTWISPISAKVNTPFSDKHPQLGFASKPGQVVRAIRQGKVVYQNPQQVVLRHPLGFYSSYQHITPQVEIHQELDQGQAIGKTTEQAFALGMKKFKDSIDPLPYLK